MKCSLEKTNELLPAFQSCLEKKEYKEALQICSEIELAIVDTDGYLDLQKDQTHFFCCYMAIYLITGDLDSARFLWRRLPDAVKSPQFEISSLWNIGKCLWLQDFSSLRRCFDISWSENVGPLALEIKASVYDRNLKQISDAYSIISFVSLCEMLMLDADDAISVCNILSWDIHSNSLFVSPKSIISDDSTYSKSTYEKDMVTLEKMSSYVANFEKKSLKVDLNANNGPPVAAGKKSAGYV